MTSGLPPAAALPRRGGTLVPPSVAGGLSLPVSLVFVGTVLLSVVLGTAEFARIRFRSAGAGHRTPVNRPLAGHGKPRARQGAGDDPPWARRHGGQAARSVPCSLGFAVARFGGPQAHHHLSHGGQRRELRLEVVGVA